MTAATTVCPGCVVAPAAYWAVSDQDRGELTSRMRYGVDERQG
jgi:hypothetical protein